MTTISCEVLRQRRQEWKDTGRQVVLTNGIFDLIHSGHVRYLEEARNLGDVLIVGLNSDASTRAIKGTSRPMIPEQERAYVLAALRWVDYVTVFAEPTAEHLVASLQPDIYVKGGDYAVAAPLTESDQVVAIDEDRLPEARVVHSYGGQVVLLPYRVGLSTSSLIERIRGAKA